MLYYALGFELWFCAEHLSNLSFQQHYKWEDETMSSLLSSSISNFGPQWSIGSKSAGQSHAGSPQSKSRATSPDRQKTAHSHSGSPQSKSHEASPDRQKTAHSQSDA